LFQQIAVGPGRQRAEDGDALLAGREHNELCFRQQRLEFADGLHAADARQVDVQQHDVGLQDRNFFNGVLARGVLAGAVKIRLLVDQLPQFVPRADIFFDD
jgi:hypothetical protein